MMIGLRPELIRITPIADPAMNALPGVVRDRTFAGNHVTLSIEIADGTILSAELPPADALPAEGDRVHVAWRPQDAILLHAS